MMKKAILFSLTITGLVGFAVWQFHFAHQGGAGETQPAVLAKQMQQPIQNQINQKPAQGKITLPAMLNSDEVISESDADSAKATKTYVNSAKPEKIMEYYATLRKARSELVQNQFNQEQQDPSWTQELTERFTVANSLVPGLPKFQISQSDCRETICALHIDMNKEAYKQYAPYMQHIGTVLGVDTWVHHDAKPDTAIIYVARVDSELPKLELNNAN